MLGDENVDPCFIAHNWKVFYGCETVSRTPLHSLVSLTTSAVFMCIQVFLISSPEVLHYLWRTLTCAE